MSLKLSIIANRQQPWSAALCAARRWLFGATRVACAAHRRLRGPIVADSPFRPSCSAWGHLFLSFALGPMTQPNSSSASGFRVHSMDRIRFSNAGPYLLTLRTRNAALVISRMCAINPQLEAASRVFGLLRPLGATLASGADGCAVLTSSLPRWAWCIEALSSHEFAAQALSGRTRTRRVPMSTVPVYGQSGDTAT